MVGDEYSRSPVRPLGRSILFCLQINCEQYLLHGSGSGYWCIIYLLHVLYRSYSTMMCKKVADATIMKMTTKSLDFAYGFVRTAMHSFEFIVLY